MHVVITSSGDWWGCSSSPEEWHDHEVPGTQTGPGSQALLPHRQAKTEQVLTCLCTLQTHTAGFTQYLLSLSFVVVQDDFVPPPGHLRTSTRPFFLLACFVCLYIGTFYWPEHFLVLILSVQAFYWLLDTVHCSNQMASHLSCFLGFELFVLKRVISVNHAFSNGRHNKHIKSQTNELQFFQSHGLCLNPCELQPPAGEVESLQLCDIYYHCN